MMHIRKFLIAIAFAGCILAPRQGLAEPPGPATLTRTPFGVVGINNFVLQDIPLLMQKLAELHVQWVRLSLSHFVFNKDKRAMTTPTYIRLAHELQRAGIQILGQVTGKRGAVDWSDPAELAEYRELVEYLLDTFPMITHWEVWNEPDGSFFFGQEPNPDYYMAIVRTAWDAIKARHPDHKVLVGAFTGTGLSVSTYLPVGTRYPRFLVACYERGLANYCDIISFHNYTNIKHSRHGLPYLRAQLGELFDVTAQYGDGDKPIWLTEAGLPIGPMEGDNKQIQTVTLEEQAEWVGIYYEEILRYRRLEKIFWMCLRNWPNPNDSGSQTHGLYTNDWQPTPSARKYAELAEKYGKDPHWSENTDPIDQTLVEWWNQNILAARERAETHPARPKE